MLDVLSQKNYLFLGSRMKRLAERMQADATKIFEANGHGKLLPAFNTVLAALDLHGDATIGQLVELIGISQPAITRTVAGMADKGLVRLTADDDDQRVRNVALTEDGICLVAHLKSTAWLQIECAAKNITRNVSGDVIDQLTEIERRLEERPLTERVQPENGLEIVNYSEELAPDFYRLNAEWIEDMFVLEPSDIEVLKDPQSHIIDKGGDILFVRNASGDIIGAGALQPVGDDGAFEFTKMGVSSTKRGEKAGEFLLVALINRAREMGVQKLHLLTNKKCEAAIHLYEKFGFRHDAIIMEKYAAKYERANVAMRYPMNTQSVKAAAPVEVAPPAEASAPEPLLEPVVEAPSQRFAISFSPEMDAPLALARGYRSEILKRAELREACNQDVCFMTFVADGVELAHSADTVIEHLQSLDGELKKLRHDGEHLIRFGGDAVGLAEVRGEKITLSVVAPSDEIVGKSVQLRYTDQGIRLGEIGVFPKKLVIDEFEACITRVRAEIMRVYRAL